MAQDSVHKICGDRREGSISEPEVYDIEFPFYWINNTGGGPVNVFPALKDGDFYGER